MLQQACRAKQTDRQTEIAAVGDAGAAAVPDRGGRRGAEAAGQRCVEKTKDDYSHHAWGNGAYYMEEWGTAALAGGKLDVAEEAFLEALAHDAGSAGRRWGCRVLCERQGRSEEAARYAALARRCWRHAEVRHFDRFAGRRAGARARRSEG